MNLSDKIKLLEKEYNNGNMVKAEVMVKELISEDSTLPHLHNSYGMILDKLEKIDDAIASYKKAIKLNPAYFEVYFNMGQLFMRNRMAEKAIPNYKKTLELKPDFVEGYIALGNALKYLKKFKEAIFNFRKVVELKPDFPGGHIVLGAALQENGQLNEAIPHLKKFGVASKARALECLYSIKDISGYNKFLLELSKSQPLNLRAATISAYASHQLDIENIYPFCKNPLDYISITNIESDLKPLSFDDFYKEVLSFDEFWEKSGKVTNKAYKTHGNIFDNKTKCILKLKEIILDQIEKYKQKFSKNKDYIITHWPKSFHLYGWHVRYLKLGKQNDHIHPDGWISGGFYIKIPKKKKNNEGAIRFDLHGFNYPVLNKNKKIPHVEYVPKEGDFCLFPSSLFHRTIPCPSDEERHMIAFDIRPKN